jgi:hypothetical protein
MDGLVEQLLRLENAKHKALILIDAPSYDANVREQMRLVAESKSSIAPATSPATSVEQLFALSQLITLNTRLLQNLLATTPLFREAGYTAKGRIEQEKFWGRVSVEA